MKDTGIKYDTMDIGGRKLFYAEAGEGKPVVLLHGNGESHAIFNVLIGQLTEAGYRVYAPDSPGQGRNEPLPEYHYKDMAEDIYAFIRALGLEKPALYGFSDGGIMGLMIALSHPDCLSVLAVSGANLSPAGLKPSFVRAFRDNRDPLTVMMLNEPDIDPAELEKIDIPVLITAGTEDLILHTETKKIADHIRDASVVVVAGEDHSSYIEGSRTIGSILLEYFQREKY